jgi:branched-chain amino acid transport system permease protein
MSVLGGARHWLGPAVGATLITISLYTFTGGQQALVGRAVVALVLIVVILVLPDGVVPTLLARMRRSSSAPAEATDSFSGRSAGGLGGASRAPHVNQSAPRAPHVLTCTGVWKSFGGVQALRGVTLTVGAGEIVGLVGPNGSGKTTLINVISGHYAADRGRITLGDSVLSEHAAHRVAALGVSRTYQIPRPFTHLTALENVTLAATFGSSRRAPGEARTEAMAWLAFTGLARRATARPAALNLHERKFLELARALASRPRVILLDEVLSGLNPTEIASAIALLREIRARGVSILFVEHVMRAVLELSDRVVVLNEGEVIAEGAPEEAMRAPRVIDVYLGRPHALA